MRRLSLKSEEFVPSGNNIFLLRLIIVLPLIQIEPRRLKLTKLCLKNKVQNKTCWWCFKATLKYSWSILWLYVSQVFLYFCHDLCTFFSFPFLLYEQAREIGECTGNTKQLHPTSRVKNWFLLTYFSWFISGET